MISTARPGQYDRDPRLNHPARPAARRIAGQLRDHRAIPGMFNEGSRSMDNAFIPDKRTIPMGIFQLAMDAARISRLVGVVVNDQYLHPLRLVGI